MRRAAWSVLSALLVGISLGLGYTWILFPHANTDARPSALQADFKDQYRSVVAAAFMATGNLPRAQARLSELGDPNVVEALNAQAQRMLASAQTFERADQLAALASALDPQSSGTFLSSGLLPTATIDIAIDAGETFTPTPRDVVAIPVSETPEVIDTQTSIGGAPSTIIESTPRPTLTPTSAPGRPFTLTGQESICNSNLPGGLLQVLVFNRNRRQLAGTEIAITWDGGKEQFFTGLKPELGNGYADFVMTHDTTYTVQLARGSDIARGISAPTCQSPDGATFLGSIKLTFQQP
jgi:hypothetical protein